MKSMTGYGRARQTIDGREMIAEVRAVNHRYFDCTVKAPRAYGFLEEAAKKYAAERISRGKVDIYLSVQEIGAQDTEIRINHELAGQYIEALRTLKDEYALADDLTVLHVAKLPDVLSLERAEVDAEALTHDVLLVLDAAIQGFDQMRLREGQKLADDVASRGDTILSLVAEAEKRSPERVAAYREKLEKKMREVLADTSIDEARLVTEAALFADRVAVDEETVRLRSHIDQLKLMLCEDAPIGRKLDFLVQEMNRESNTIGSKSNDVPMARLVVDLKSEIEKIREQIQNIE